MSRPLPDIALIAAWTTQQTIHKYNRGLLFPDTP